jgi:hypothetical protein
VLNPIQIELKLVGPTQEMLYLSKKITGVCYITENDWISNECFQLFSDSAGNADLGCAAFLAGKCVQYQWPKHYNLLEFLYF